MRPHPTPKIRDEGLGGASKMMDDNLSVFGKIVETVRPLLHHAAALGEVLRVVVGGMHRGAKSAERKFLRRHRSE